MLAPHRPAPAVRLRVAGPDGTVFAPLGRVAEFATAKNEAVGGHVRVGRERFTYVDGSCEIRLPVGVPLRVKALKGPEYEPLDAVSQTPGRYLASSTVQCGTS